MKPLTNLFTSTLLVNEVESFIEFIKEIFYLNFKNFDVQGELLQSLVVGLEVLANHLTMVSFRVTTPIFFLHTFLVKSLLTDVFPIPYL